MSQQDKGLPATTAEDVSDRPVSDVVDRLHRYAQTESVALSDLLESLGAASFASAMMLPALLVVSPLSGIPLFSSVCGIAIAIIAAQMLFKRTHLALPDIVTRQTVPGPRLRGVLMRMRRMADFLDRRTHAGRLGRLVGRGARVLPQSLCVIAGASMPLLELVPFSSSILGAAVLSFSIAMLTRDGAFVLAGTAILGAAGAVPVLVF